PSVPCYTTLVSPLRGARRMPGSIYAFEQPELFEQQLSEFSARFVSLPADRVDHELDAALLTLLEAMGFDRSSIAESSADGQRLEITHSRTSAHAPPMPQGDLTAAWPWYVSELRRGRTLRFDRLPDDLPVEATAEREYCARVGMRSHLTFPFTVGDRVIGAMGFATFRREMHWSPRLVRSLRIVSEVIANAV